jgi:hypothetical protein
MVKKLILYCIVTFTACTYSVAQVKPFLSGDIPRFREELIKYLGPNLNDEQTGLVDSFFMKWDSSGFSTDNMQRIIGISSRLIARNMRPVPHFIDFLKTLSDFTGYPKTPDFINNWLKGLSQTVSGTALTNTDLDRYFRNTDAMIRENIISISGNISWRIKGGNLRYECDSIFKVIVNDVTLNDRSGQDSTEIYNVTGVYYPELTEFHGLSGIIYWDKAGYGKDDVFTEISGYIINTLKSQFEIDSARLTHKTYFQNPVYGKLTDQASSYRSPERAIYPRFEPYSRNFIIDNLYEGVNYEGGLALEGASVKGTGDPYRPAKISLFRNDTLYIKIRSDNYLFNKSTIVSQDALATLMLGTDSIFHSSVGFSYNTQSREVSLYRTNNPVSKSPYYDSYHHLDMYFDYMSWNMNESLITLSRARGASMGQARFESVSFFDKRTFDRLMGIDDYHPLYRLKQFSEWYYSETFPVIEFAKWMKKPPEAVIGLCIDLADKGFLFYDRVNNEVTLKKKIDDFIAANARKTDYDVISIFSETYAPTDNASLDLKNYRLSINGVSSVHLSDSQRVAIYPYNRKLVVGRNRDINFDGVVQAGLFTIFGHNFIFNYDTFKIRLQNIDSIRIAVETDKRDGLGNPVIRDVDNLIQLTTAELYIDDPVNKSGLRSLQQYPIINAVTDSYIFFDKLPGLEGIYKRNDFYFKVDPFTYDNIDHYNNEQISLPGDFVGGNILDTSRQYLTIQKDNSLGFNATLPEEGVDIYGGKGKLYKSITLSNEGLIGSGQLDRLTSTTESKEFRLFPDSMVTTASKFDIVKDESGRFPDLKSRDVSIKWSIPEDEWNAVSQKGKNFEMFDNGTVMGGSLSLSPTGLKGAGIIDLSDSRIISDGFQFTSSTIQADTSDYNLKSLKGDGYAFIAENTNTTIDFDKQISLFSLNTDSSVVKFPEIEYICTMTDFSYDMKNQVLSMEQRGKASSPLMSKDQMIKLNFRNLDKPTFFSTNNLRDTISFSSWKGSYNLRQEFVEADNINYIHIADALIQPDQGKIVINKRAVIKPLQNAIIAVNNKHILHSANIRIENSSRYSGSALYDYVDENNDIQQINFPEISVDTATTTAKGYIANSQKFMLSPAFSFAGDVTLSARSNNLSFTGVAGIVHNCSKIKSYNLKFKSTIDPLMVMIPVGDKPRDANDNLVYSGSFINIDSTHIYPAFLSARKSWSDAQIVNAMGMLYFEKASGKYKIGSLQKLSDPTGPGELITFDKNFCILSGEGKLNFGTDFNLLHMDVSGKVIHDIDSGKVSIEAILAFDFYFSDDALKIMSDEIRMMPTLTAVNLNSDFYKKGLKDLLGESAANQINEEMGLFGTSRNLPKEFRYKLLLNDVNLYWNESTASFRSKGRIGIGFIGQQPVNVYMDGYIEIQRRRTGDLIDIYLKANESTWYYFSYFRGVMMTQSGNNDYNTLISTIKLKDRRHPDATVRVPYTYMIAVEDRLDRFIYRMTNGTSDEEPLNQ